MIFDTEFLIALQRGSRRCSRAEAQAFLREHPAIPLYITRITWMEIAAGAPTRADVALAVRGFTVLELTPDACWQASRVFRALRLAGAGIGHHDSLIAGLALHHRLPLVSNNAEHFDRVAGLQRIAYGKPEARNP